MIPGGCHWKEKKEKGKEMGEAFWRTKQPPALSASR
jgi:hypothetical protein